jgi:hypothetical protein
VTARHRDEAAYAKEPPLFAQRGTPASGSRESADGSELGKRGLVVALSLLT